jgi:hypothetical protein
LGAVPAGCAVGGLGGRGRVPRLKACPRIGHLSKLRTACGGGNAGAYFPFVLLKRFVAIQIAK